MKSLTGIANGGPQSLAVEEMLSYKKDVYPSTVTTDSINHKIHDLSNRRILSGPNCWGTVAYLLHITPTFRYVSDIEFIGFTHQAKIIDYSNGSNISDGAVITIWNNFNNSIVHDHASLLIDRVNDKVFEKIGPDATEHFQYVSLAGSLHQADSPLYNKINLVDNFDQPVVGKYAILLDFSNVARKMTSDLEEKISAYYHEGVLLNEASLLRVLEAYQREIPKISSSRDLSLAEGIYHLLKSMGNELNELQDKFLLIREKPIANLLRSYSGLRATIDQETSSIADQINVYRRSIQLPRANLPRPLPGKDWNIMTQFRT